MTIELIVGAVSVIAAALTLVAVLISASSSHKSATASESTHPDPLDSPGNTSRKPVIWESARLDIAVTILLDALLVVLAFGIRTLLLWLFSRTIQEESWAVDALTLVLDIGIIATVLIYVLADLGVRILGALRVFQREMHGENARNGTGEHGAAHGRTRRSRLR